ncbi:Oligopeptide transport ATP-binding protein OppD [Methylacidimicrobium cyclopophantes]|uniref:Oligopeptide transport ATP-binding protein OppD n=1 Tax=Methylacidimicrobium cyclopophantes TaxID=1041766 RepID=A0A5E6MF85_9BACT|nr:ABC transporter ATP-binding protein [Methylacidimicrobium cyclopophantes]VVM07646.1 Oligopeptide transport ATP-binding protein OppD [Methylacidimicrobium cyclopophantes]
MPDPDAIPLLEVSNLSIDFVSEERIVHAVDGVSFSMQAGSTLAVVGESGSGKSVTALSLARLLPSPPAQIRSGKVFFEGTDLLTLPERALRHYRGGKIAYVFQEPSTSLNPVFSVGFQLSEAMALHRPDLQDRRAAGIAALTEVGIRDPERCWKSYPHELSGGMQQRVMIAMALVCRPRLLVADEPTTALDVTIQAQILQLLREIRSRFGMSILLITHNFGLVKGFADHVLVMFRGKIVEQGPTDAVLASPRHPYTQALIACVPRLGESKKRLTTIDYARLDALLSQS